MTTKRISRRKARRIATATRVVFCVDLAAASALAGAIAGTWAR